MFGVPCRKPLHYVTCGLTERFAKESSVVKWSGWGFELTFRLAGAEAGPPTWPFTLLGTVGRYVWSGNALHVADHINLAAPITGWPDVHGAPGTDVTGLLVVPDMELPTIGTPNGKVGSCNSSGSPEERGSVMGDAEVGPLIETLSAISPLLVTDLSRTRD